MHALVATVVHHPEDARILHRQIRALLDAGHRVTYIAPFADRGVTPWQELTPVDVPRAAGRRRVGSLRAARAALARHAADADLLLFHDPELLLALPRRRPVTVWDVHEDAAAALLTKPWMPRPLRRPLGPVVRGFERHAEQRMHLILAEEGYRGRFALPHPVVPNTTYVPDRPERAPGTDRVVYLGHLSAARGAHELVEMGRRLRPHGVRVEVIGAADPSIRPMLRQAQLEEAIHWYGFVPNDQALRMVSGAMAGICLLQDTPNYRSSLPTKVVEYMAHGLPVITTPNPAAVSLVTQRPEGDCGLVVPFGDAAAAADAVLRLRSDSDLRNRQAATGHRIARTSYHWPVQAELFVRQLEEWAAAAGPHPAAPGTPDTLPLPVQAPAPLEAVAPVAEPAKRLPL
ncbi:glycosyltransferase family 4 protein [Streptomonospora nanhaiensis]|uniref:Glycosyltransferase involved in cell wall biosynthesis n=1 Tax=Streptomonospora nanhaiensis TaxID=1323731 RepID=A0A853BSN3_9ACTN|nr:glycosyltransferase family 4 protein [Streptomonospora nanhaiensis]MBV2362901.1 glycosyltransferase family 4 protein [Streptomonospora nanhaiensis]MBX9389561.1 glycosyltransferase family 4 protein [Streptomonospora nanhaiensis]NYI97735.1 glycosyltransferase involved in cell wall biosynthesis [Streptomonospora nanhaiensis]